MNEFDALSAYPEPKILRKVGPHTRTIENRIIASYRGAEFYDGDRNNGYGGYVNDGRWIGVAKDMISRYGLNKSSSVLQLGCDKGFLIEAFHELLPEMRLSGTDISQYALDSSSQKIRQFLKIAPFTELPFANSSFDLVVAIGPVYSLNLGDAIKCLKEINRVQKRSAFITLGAYDSEEDLRLFRYWTLLGTTILHTSEWVKVLEHVNYSGDYKFNTAKSLNLIED